MFKSTILVLSLIALGSVRASLNLESNPWVKIEKRLIKSTNSVDTNDNLKIAKEYLEETIKSKPSLGKSNSKLTEALTMLINLETSVNKCDEETANVFYNSYPTAHMHSFARLPRIIKSLATQHGKNCRSTYMGMLDTRLMAMPKTVQDVTYALEEVLENQVFPGGRQFGQSEQSARAYFGIVKDSDILEPNDSATAYDTCSIKPGLKCKKIGPCLVDCLLKPCEDYVEKLEDVFGPAMNANIEPDTEMYEKDSPETHKFFQHWAQYKICIAFKSRGDKIIDDLIEEFEDSHVNSMTFQPMPVAMTIG